jgi:RNA polymerase sigma-70 factor (ECF subfamily)
VFVNNSREKKMTNITTMEFQNAYATGFPRTVRFIRSKGINPSDAEEIAQAAWVKGWERRQQLKCAESLSSWVNSIAFNVLRNFARKSKRSTEFQACHDRGVAPAAVPALLDLDRVTSGCSPLDRRLLWFRYVEGRSSAEAGKILGMSAVAARIRVMRTRNRILKAWKSSSRRCGQLPSAAS